MKRGAESQLLLESREAEQGRFVPLLEPPSKDGWRPAPPHLVSHWESISGANYDPPPRQHIKLVTSYMKMFGKEVTRIDEHKIPNLLEDCLVLRRSQAVQFGMVDVQISKQPLLVSSLQEPTDELPSPSLRHWAPSRGASRRSFNEIQVHRRNPSLDKVVPPFQLPNKCLNNFLGINYFNNTA